MLELVLFKVCRAAKDLDVPDKEEAAGVHRSLFRAPNPSPKSQTLKPQILEFLHSQRALASYTVYTLKNS